MTQDARDIPVMLQTIYAELLDRATSDAFAAAFPGDGVFTPKVLRGRRYWYFQASKANGRGQRYVGPETPELLVQIAAHRAERGYDRAQRSLVASLVRGGNLPRPPAPIGELVAALADAGVFRLRGILIGTVAYQTYAAMLGARLPATMVQTGDVDVAQFTEVSAAIADRTPPMIDVLRRADESFRPVPHIDRQRVVSYVAASGLRVDFLTPNRGRDTEQPRTLPALGTDAQPLRFLDFLIREPERAVLLHGAGVLVSVPAPQRYALHKLIVTRRRREGDAKRNKDLAQAAALLHILVRRRPHELRAAWAEAFARGRTWQRLLGEGLGMLHPAMRDSVLRTVGATRAAIPDFDLRFVPERAGYDKDNDTVRFFASASGERAATEAIRCCITRDALEACFAPAPLDAGTCLATFRQHRSAIEAAARMRWLRQPVEPSGEVTLTRADFATPA
jgi:hypothetical protein